MTLDLDIRTLDFAAILARRAEELGSRTYLRFEDERYSYLDAHLISNRLANGLLAAGVRRGDHVALLLGNSPDLVWYYFALGKIGAVSVPLNTAAKGALLARYTIQSRARFLVVETDLIERWREIAAECPEVKRCFVTGTGGALPIDADAIAHETLLTASDAPPDIPVRFTDLAYLSFTSGTSGPSKANMATNAHTFAMAAAVANAFGYGPDEVMYTCLPLFHGNAMRSLFVAMLVGGSIALARKFSASGFWADVRRFEATQFNLLGAMANILWAQPASPEDRNHRARKCMIVPIPSFAEPFAQRFGLELCSTYALTDFGYISFLTTADPKEKWYSAGRVQADVELVIVDDDDIEVPLGQTGEICVRNKRPWIAAQGYFGMPEATVSAWRNLWFHTGDRGYLGPDGYLFFVDRKKDAIRRRGENISSYEVEQIVLRHPAVLDVAAFAVASEMSEDEVMVSVVLRDGGRLDEAELVRWCNRQMAHFMVPRFVQFVPGLPRTLTEKVEKYDNILKCDRAAVESVKETILELVGRQLHDQLRVEAMWGYALCGGNPSVRGLTEKFLAKES